MSQNEKIEDIIDQRGSFFFPEYRVTCRDSEGRVGISDWKASKPEALQEARERLRRRPDMSADSQSSRRQAT